MCRCLLQADRLQAAKAGDVDAVWRCLAAEVDVNRKDEVGARSVCKLGQHTKTLT